MSVYCVNGKITLFLTNLRIPLLHNIQVPGKGPKIKNIFKTIYLITFFYK